MAIRMNREFCDGYQEMAYVAIALRGLEAMRPESEGSKRAVAV